MSARPQNIGIKAIEVYFPSQVSVDANGKAKSWMASSS